MEMFSTDDWLKIGQGLGIALLGALGLIGLRKGGRQEEDKPHEADYTVVQGSIADVRPLKDMAEEIKKGNDIQLGIHKALLDIGNRMEDIQETLTALQSIARAIDEDRRIEAEVQARLRNEKLGRS